tara:strand:- start:301 stop:516 length:216 start_codon:yes stop_codon:yes gene_type:complete
MIKFNYPLLMIFLLTHCSIDTKSGLWQNKDLIKGKKKISKINFNKDLAFDNFKKNVVLYSKKSNYPNLMEK